jgi:hypothetical protein
MHLQRTIGNRAAGARLRSEAADVGAKTVAQVSPVASRTLQAIVQRHPIVDGVHTAHKGKVKPHSDTEEADALKAAQQAWTGIEKRVEDDVLPKKSSESTALLPDIEKVVKIIDLSFATSEASGKKQLREIRILKQKADGRLGKVQGRAKDQEREEKRAVAYSASKRVPNFLSRIEANARDGAVAVRSVVTTKSTPATQKLLGSARRDLEVAEAVYLQLLEVAALVADEADLAEAVTAHKTAADAALHGLRNSVAVIERIVKARHDVDAAQKALDDSKFKAVTLQAAEEAYAELQQALQAEKAYVAEFSADLERMGPTAFSNGKSKQDLLNERQADLDELAEAVEDARLEVVAAKAAVQVAAQQIPGQEDALKQALGEQALATTGVEVAATAEITRIDDLQALREKVGGQAELAELQAAIPDAAPKQEADTVTTTFHVGQHYRCTMTVPRPEPGSALSMAREWAPLAPRRLNDREMRDYRRCRDAALSEVARLIGGSVMCIEL